MMPRSVQNLLKSFMLAMVVAGLTLVPFWQAVGHTPHVEHSVIAFQDAGSSLGQDHFGAHEAGHHVGADHAHELPILRVASLPQSEVSGGRWEIPASSNGVGTQPYNLKQPPRHI
jgi:hypothetical protein